MPNIEFKITHKNESKTYLKKIQIIVIISKQKTNKTLNVLKKNSRVGHIDCVLVSTKPLRYANNIHVLTCYKTNIYLIVHFEIQAHNKKIFTDV